VLTHTHRACHALVILATAFLCVLSYGAASASAYVGPEPLTNPTYASKLAQLLKTATSDPTSWWGGGGTSTWSGVGSVTNPATGSAITAAELEAGMASAEVAAGTLPVAAVGVASVPVTVTVIAAAAAAYTGWKIGSFIYKKVSTDDSGSAGITALRWNCYSFGGTSPCGGSLSQGGNNYGVSATSVPCVTACYIATATDSFTNTSVYCVPVTGAAGCGNTDTTLNTYLHNLPGTEVSNPTATACGSSTVVGTCFTKYRTGEQMAAHQTIESTDATGYAAGANNSDRSGFSAPTPSSTGLSDAAGALGILTPVPDLTPAQGAARCAIDMELDPAYDCSSIGQQVDPSLPHPPFVLPRPLVTETAEDYAGRLRELGYLGDIVLTDADMTGYPSGTYAARLSAASLTQIQIGTHLPLPLYDPDAGTVLDWPTSNDLGLLTWPAASVDTSVSPSTTTTLELQRVPSSYDPLAHGATTSTVTGAGVVPSSNHTCNCGPIDFTPLEAIDYGTKFPFGVFTWLGGITDLSTSDDPVSFVLPYGAHTETVTLSNSDWETTYRPIVFPFLEFLMTVFGIWFLAFRIIGFGGD